LSDSTIGIKVADGSYYPVLEHGFTGRKKLTLTTVKNNQDKVQIDIYRGDGKSLSEAHYLGSLILENIPSAAKGVPEIELSIGVDPDGQLSAEASEVSTGESQRFTASLTTLATEETYQEAEFALEPEAPLTGESYRAAETDRRIEPQERRGPNVILLVLFVLLGVLLVAAIAYFVYRGIQGPQVPALSTGQTSSQPAPKPAAPAAPAPSQAAPAKPAPAQPAPAATQTQQGTGGQAAAPATQTQQGTGGQAAAPATPAPPKPASKGGVTYRIKKGDTLWDIAATYYRNPWLYPRLAKANSIRNPDLIFAGTQIFIPEN
jgi:nucleoid-associated protein YgaU